MRLHLSKSCILDTDYTNERGEVLYKVQANSTWWPNSAKISKQMPQGIPLRQFSCPSRSSTNSSELGKGVGLYDLDDLPSWSAGEKKYDEKVMEKGDMGSGDIKWVDTSEDRLMHLARIDFRTINPSIISMGGQDFEVSSFFRKGSLGWYGRDRIFMGPDGREYKWVLGFTTSRLLLNDESKTMVAKYCTKFWNIPHKPENMYLEIMPNGEHMVDLILVTFLYIEQKRSEREKSLQHAGS